MEMLIVAITCSIAGGAITWLVRKLIYERDHIPVKDHNALVRQYDDLKTQYAILEANLSHIKQQWEEAKQELSQKHLELQKTNQALSAANAQLHWANEKLNTQKQEIENLGEKFENTFKVLANNILEDKTRRFSEAQEKNLKGILDPLEKEIKQFKHDIETKHKQESDERISLKEQVRNMTSLNQTLSEQANKLTETLRLQVKQQGDWGESILEAILENSGLQKGLQYFTQHAGINDDGKSIRPDVLIKYPDERSIIIDSKVSLVHYYNMCSAITDEEQKICLRQLLHSFRLHIDGLASKNYQDIAHALDFIIMFVPVEPAYIAAMHADTELWQYAYKKKILLISPANLIATLKLVKDMWRKDAVDKNAHEIAEKAGRLYDKLVSFVESFEEVGRKLEKTTECWQEARKQLTAGKGNLVSRAHAMNQLHINSKKQLPDDFINEAVLNDLMTEENSQ
jgi:DNA recombination protein RmuC